jgi:hypothetical protein
MTMVSQGQSDWVAAAPVDCNCRVKDLSRRESSSTHSVKVDDDEATERTEMSVRSMPSKDIKVKCRTEIHASHYMESCSSPSDVKSPEQEYHLPSVASNDVTISNTSGITIDLTYQKQRREQDHHKEAFEMALEQMRATNLDPDSDEYAIMFLKVVTQVKAELKKKYESDVTHSRLVPTVYARSKDMAPSKPARVESQSCPRLFANVSESSEDVSPYKPTRVDIQSCPRLIASVSESTKDVTPCKPARLASQPLSRLLVNEPESSNDLTPTKPARMESQLSSSYECDKVCSTYMTPSRKPLRVESQPDLRDHDIHQQQASCRKIQSSYRRYLARKIFLQTIKKARMDRALLENQEDTEGPPSQSVDTPDVDNGLSACNPSCTRIPLKITEKPLRYISLEVPSHSDSSSSSGIKLRNDAGDNRRRQHQMDMGMIGEEQVEGGSMSAPSAPHKTFQSKLYKDIDFVAPMQQNESTKTTSSLHVRNNGRPHSYSTERLTSATAESPTKKSTSSLPTNIFSSPCAAPNNSFGIPTKLNVSSLLQSASATCKKAVPKMMPLGGKTSHRNKASQCTNPTTKRSCASQERKRNPGSRGPDSQSKGRYRDRTCSVERSRNKSSDRISRTDKSRNNSMDQLRGNVRSRSSSREAPMSMGRPRSRSKEMTRIKDRRRTKSQDGLRNDTTERQRSKSKERPIRRSLPAHHSRGADPKSQNKRVFVKVLV